MSLQNLIETAYQVFRERTANARVILLHPRSQFRSVLVAKLLQQTDLPTVYYALGQDDQDLPSFLYRLTHDVAHQYPLFGRHTNLMLPEVFARPTDYDRIVTTFARDLSEVSNLPFLFILDEYDRSDVADDIQYFVERLAHHLPDNCQMVLNSRTLPRLPWVSLIACNSAVILEDDKVLTQDFYEKVQGNKNRLDVFALGPGYVLLNDTVIETWEGHLPRLLFFFALDRPVVTRSEICQAFWPELDSDQAVNVFHVTKRRLHKALDLDVLVHEGGYYQISPDFEVHFDITDYVNQLVIGRNEALDLKSRMRAWTAAIDMYRGPFLQGHFDGWVVNRRVDYRAGFIEALTSMAAVRLTEERREHALALYLRAVQEDNRRQDIHREVLRLFANMGRRSEVASHFYDLETSGVALEPATAELYHDIMS
ncbi:MAG: AfsR/SARP family transcriptional regulator [Phototrophicaceae bacterium]